MSRRILTAESVTEGHPDKVADQIADAVLDAIIQHDPRARVACEVLVTTGLVLIAGEITTNALPDLAEIARGTLRGIGYTSADYGIDGERCGVLVAVNQQSPDIALGVDQGGAGDQGMMFGYATDEMLEHPAAADQEGESDLAHSFMPAPIVLANRLTERMSELRHDESSGLPWLRPDGKAQVTLEYEQGMPRRVVAVVVSTQHAPEISIDEVRAEVERHVITPVLPPDLFDPGSVRIHINPTGRFVVGGPQGDTGLTGRKLIVDTYGGAARHGGGAFSGKDPSKVDRSGAYGARWAAKHVVAAGLARRCEVSLAYAIGVTEPIAVQVETFGTAQIPDERIEEAVREVFDFRPHALIERLRLLSPIYQPTAAYGHFGRRPYNGSVAGESYRFFTWEDLDRVAELRTAAGI